MATGTNSGVPALTRSTELYSQEPGLPEAAEEPGLVTSPEARTQVHVNQDDKSSWSAWRPKALEAWNY